LIKKKTTKNQDVCLWGEEPVREVASSWLWLWGHDLYLKCGKRVISLNLLKVA